MIRSLVLFFHIAGAMALFAGLALEAFGSETAQRVAPRTSGIAMSVTMVFGFFLGARIGVLGNAWVHVSLVAIALMAMAGVLARRSIALRRISLRFRTTLGLAVVFLMVAKPDAVESLTVLSLAFVAALAIGVPWTQRVGFSRA